MYQRLKVFYVINGNDEISSGYDKILNFSFQTNYDYKFHPLIRS